MGRELLDLDIDVSSLARAGRRAEPLLCEVVRPLRTSDLVLLATNRETQAPALKRITERHHALARLLASGMRPMDCSVVTGYDPSRISILQADETFKELVEFYANQVAEEFADVHTHMAGLNKDAILELRHRFEEDPEKFTNSQIFALVGLLSDRTGHGPQTQSQHLHLHANIADRMDAARERLKKARDVTPVEKECEDG